MCLRIYWTKNSILARHASHVGLWTLAVLGIFTTVCSPFEVGFRMGSGSITPTEIHSFFTSTGRAIAQAVSHRLLTVEALKLTSVSWDTSNFQYCRNGVGKYLRNFACLELLVAVNIQIHFIYINSEKSFTKQARLIVYSSFVCFGLGQRVKIFRRHVTNGDITCFAMFPRLSAQKQDSVCVQARFCDRDAR